MLKRVLSILPAFLFLFVQTPLHEFMKVPFIFSHYLEHKNADKKLDIGAFIDMHYDGNDHNDKDQQKDHQLPFKDGHMHLLGSMFTCIGGAHFLLKPSLPVYGEFCLREDQHPNNPFLSQIFQPPRVS